MSRHPDSAHRGFTLLEVLITIVLIAGALLGTAGMQAFGLKLTQASQFRTQAVFLATDIIERLEANNDGAKAGAYEKPVVVGGGGAAPNCNVATPCTAQDLAAFDLKLFETNLVAHLPGVSAKIEFSGAGPWIYKVVVTWQEPSSRPKGTKAASSATVDTLTYTVSRTVYDRSTVL